MKNQGRVFFAFYVTAFALILIFTSSSCTTISTETYNLKTPLLEQNSSIRIVLIADLHNSIYGNEQDELIDLIINANPDLIILAGDIIDEVSGIIGTRLLLSGISGLAPIYYVTGNHEYWNYEIDIIRKELLSHGVIILSDTYEIINIRNNNILLAGIEDPFKKLFEDPLYDQVQIMESIFRELDEIPLYKILIAHRPELIENYKRFSFDLILSGHTHGGQIRIPNTRHGIYAPHQGLFPRYAGGLYEHEYLIHIVSRGLSISHPRLPRIFNPPELVIIVIESEE